MNSSENNSTASRGVMSSSASGQNDLKKLKSKYGSKLSTLRELFTDWSDEDLLFAIQDADGDLELTVDRISEGNSRTDTLSAWILPNDDNNNNNLCRTCGSVG